MDLEVADVLIAALAVIVSVFLYMLEKQKKAEMALNTYREIHELFWTDESIRDVRMWLACETGYRTISPVLDKRKNIDEKKINPEELSVDEYMILEKIDRFLNFLKRIHAVGPNLKDYPDLWESLFFDYWLKQFYLKGRESMTWYLNRFYTSLSEIQKNV